MPEISIDQALQCVRVAVDAYKATYDELVILRKSYNTIKNELTVPPPTKEE